VRAKRGDISRRRNNLWQRTRYLPPACVVPLSFLAKGIGKRGRLSEEETHLDLSFKLSIERKLK